MKKEKVYYRERRFLEPAKRDRTAYFAGYVSVNKESQFVDAEFEISSGGGSEPIHFHVDSWNLRNIPADEIQKFRILGAAFFDMATALDEVNEDLPTFRAEDKAMLKAKKAKRK